MKYILTVIFLSLYTVSVRSSFCYWNAGCPYKYFSTKTAYDAVRGDIRDSIVKLKDCESIGIWGLFRHGKRNPGAYFGLKMKEAIVIRDYVVSSYEKGRSSLCSQDIENLRNWQVDNELFDNVNSLTNEGYRDMLNIGKRMKQTFSRLLNNIEEGNYTIRSAYGDWIQQSAVGFAEGLKNKHLIVTDTKANEFSILSPYKTCKRHQEEVINNPDLYAEVNKYQSTSDYLAAKDRIQRRIGIEYILSDENITALYDLCRYTWSGVENKPSPWCALFTTDDLKVLEYVGELKSYYRNAYGMSMSQTFGSIPLADLLKSFREAKNGEGNKITAYVTHASMLDMVYTALDFFKDEPPLIGTFRIKERRWRTSKSTCFSANLFAVLNRCTKNGNADYNVVFYLNEEPLRSICEEGVCSWKEFENKLEPFVNTSLEFCD